MLDLLKPVPRLVGPEEHVELCDELVLALRLGHLPPCLLRPVP